MSSHIAMARHARLPLKTLFLGLSCTIIGAQNFATVTTSLGVVIYPRRASKTGHSSIKSYICYHRENYGGYSQNPRSSC